MINGDEQRSTVAKRKATAPVGGIFQKKKSQDRINPGPSDRIRSRTTERPNDLLHKEWDTTGLLWNMTVSSMFDPASSVRSTQIRKRF